ncbi:MAG: hypothetical protein NC397_08215 [Clostridium sp.]|nr:hypothetical protein [Clostridium sp.]
MRIRNMKKSFKCILLFLLAIIVLFIMLFSLNYFFGGYSYNNDIECLNHYMSQDCQIKEIVYKYENEDNEILLYNSNNGMFFNCILDKKSNSNVTKYRLNHNSNSTPVTWNNEWEEIGGKLKYIFVKYEDDIKNIDCGDCSPLGTKINYKLMNGEEKSCWIYIIDRTKDNSVS